MTVKKKDEYDHISSRTIEEIRFKINEMLSSVEKEDQCDDILKVLKNKNSRKPDLIFAYSTLEQRLKEAQFLDSQEPTSVDKTT